ncbi:hypothetical protein [Ileibacterium valens]|uniref:hypothetical protein n=1 Tax=Ileibacterium valens TaxID=1862668 RepID=UPI002570F68F|nr:hypothetical protein [Ileibacterium valens]
MEIKETIEKLKKKLFPYATKEWQITVADSKGNIHSFDDYYSTHLEEARTLLSQ